MPKVGGMRWPNYDKKAMEESKKYWEETGDKTMEVEGGESLPSRKVVDMVNTIEQAKKTRERAIMTSKARKAYEMLADKNYRGGGAIGGEEINTPQAMPMPPRTTPLAAPNAQSMEKTKMVNSLIKNLSPQNTMKAGGKALPKYRGGGMVNPMNNLANRIAMLKKGGKINK